MDIKLLPCLGYCKQCCPNIGVHLSFQIFSGYISRSGIAGSYGSSTFSFLRNLNTVLHNGVGLYIPTNSIGRFPSLYTLSRICLWIFLMIAILAGVKWYLFVVFICISWLINEAEDLFMCPLAICVSSLEKCLFRSAAHFLSGLFVLMLLSIMSCLYILEVNPLSVTSFANISSQSVGCAFVLFIVSVAEQKLLSLSRSYLFIFYFISNFLGDGSKKMLPWFLTECSAYDFL